MNNILSDIVEKAAQKDRDTVPLPDGCFASLQKHDQIDNKEF